MRDLVYELDGLAIGMAANSLARETVNAAAREIDRLRGELQRIADLPDTPSDELATAVNIAHSALQPQN